MKRIPRHIGFIMDGNRRYAKTNNMHAFMGHEAGHKTLTNVIGWCRELGVHEITVFAFSIQNFNRAPEEVKALLDIFRKTAQDIEKKKEKHKKEGVRVRFIGRIHLLPSDVQEAMHKAMDATKDNNTFLLNVAMAYGGREEIVDAVRALATEVKEGKISPQSIDEKSIRDHLLLQSEPDLIIRTSGEHRTSNFLTWQSTYAEWIFSPKHWPAFSKEDLLACIEEFGARERRFGK